MRPMPIQPSECFTAIFFSLDFQAGRLEHNPKKPTFLRCSIRKADHSAIIAYWRLATGEILRRAACPVSVTDREGLVLGLDRDNPMELARQRKL